MILGQFRRKGKHSERNRSLKMGSTLLQAHNHGKFSKKGSNSNIAARSSQSFSNIRKIGKGLNIAASSRIQNLQSSSENPRKTKKGLDITASSKSQDLRKDFQVCTIILPNSIF
ncbi:hypothetical protein MRB53_002305 [Persea americana]|uniref:Uncharacterized protein n=1 Tax=Persea americana TaxID=3435 RepID=A0ACC2MU40_PERAE|nr:hypothetical protein MRB53_002305 [Persea americana]